MGYEVVEPGPDDFPDAFRPVFDAFADPRPSDEVLEDAMVEGRAVRALAAKDGDQWVGLAGQYRFELTVPGPSQVRCAGVTWVGVRPTHRRQGITTDLIGRLLDESAERGDVASALLAMEGAIYGRFGYGVATQYAEHELDVAGSAFAVAPDAPGTLRLHDHEQGSALAAQAWDRLRLLQPGSLDRHDWMWELMRRDRSEHRAGYSALFWLVHHDPSGEPDGYATYRIKETTHHGLPRFEAKVFHLAGATPDIEAALVRFIADLDLVTSLRFFLRPVDDHLRWRLVDPRQLRTVELADLLWVRLVDVAAALAARTYGTADDLVLYVDDPFRPAWGGTFRLTSDADGRATVARDDLDPAAADLRLDTSSLASLWLGGVSATTLARAGRLGGTPEAVARATRLFATPTAPFCSVEF